jgi:hypothetical protein
VSIFRSTPGVRRVPDDAVEDLVQAAHLHLLGRRRAAQGREHLDAVAAGRQQGVELGHAEQAQLGVPGVAAEGVGVAAPAPVAGAGGGQLGEALGGRLERGDPAGEPDVPAEQAGVLALVSADVEHPS